MIDDKAWRTLLLLTPLLIVMSGTFATGCGGGDHSFTVHASTLYGGCDNGGDQNVSVAGQRQGPTLNTSLSLEFGYFASGGECGLGTCHATTDANGNYLAGSVDVPAPWLVERGGDIVFPDICKAANFLNVNPGDMVPVTCQIISPFSFFPDPIDLSAVAPTEFTIAVPAGTASSQYGMPQISFYSNGGGLVATVTAYWVSDDWSSLKAPLPVEMTSVYSGDYGALIRIVMSDGSLKELNGGIVHVVGNYPPDSPPPPPDMT